MFFTNLVMLSRRTVKFAACMLAGLLASPALGEEKIHLVTESYAPMNFTENGELAGVSVDLLHKVMADAAIPYDMEIMPWARAYSLAESQNGYCVFTTVHNQERDQKFQWVEPLLHGFAYLIKKKGSEVKAASIEEATQYLVGTQRGDYTVGVLEARNFKKIDLAANIDVTLNKLLKGRIDLMPMTGPLLVELQGKGIPIEPIQVLAQDVNGLACNKQVSPATIAKMQASLDKFIADGTQARIFDRYGWVEKLK